MGLKFKDKGSFLPKKASKFLDRYFKNTGKQQKAINESVCWNTTAAELVGDSGMSAVDSFCPSLAAVIAMNYRNTANEIGKKCSRRKERCVLKIDRERGGNI